MYNSPSVTVHVGSMDCIL